MSPRICRHLVAAVALLTSSTVWAQPNQTAPEPTRATELSMLAGGASATHTGPMLAGIAGWEMNRWTSFEARGAWFGRGPGANGFGADLSATVNVIPKQEVTPYVGLGFGLYRATFQSPANATAAFYRRRMDAARSGPVSFTDPALRLTAGVDVITRRNLTIRPEVSALIVRGDRRGTAMAAFGVRFGYRFEEKTIR
jgi:hypothetical protein